MSLAEIPQEFTIAWTRVQSTWPTLLDSADKVEELEKAVLELATRGLVALGRPDDEPVADQLKRLRQAQLKKDSKGGSEPTPVEDLPYEIFSGPATPLPQPIPFADATTGSMQGPRYTSLAKLLSAKRVSDLFT